MQKGFIFSATDVQNINNKLIAQRPKISTTAVEEIEQLVRVHDLAGVISKQINTSGVNQIQQQRAAYGEAPEPVRATKIIDPEKLNEYFHDARKIMQGV